MIDQGEYTTGWDEHLAMEEARERQRHRNFAGNASSDRAVQAYRPLRVFCGGPLTVAPPEPERITIGANSSAWFRKDPRAMAYTASKYLTVARMLEGMERVLEVGCGDGFGLRIVAQHVRFLDAIDFYRSHWMEATQMCFDVPNVRVRALDILDGPSSPGVIPFDAAYALDVFEHIDPAQASLFLKNICASIKPDGVFICGAPTLNSQAYASEHGRAGHINCMHPADMVSTLKQHFVNVFSFGLTDGHLTQGLEAMRQYQLCLAVGVRK